MRKGISLIISAASGSGKSTLCKALLEKASNLSYSISCTTRPIRPGEEDGKDYYFIDRKEFEKRRLNGEFAEWAQVHGNFYGTPIKPVLKALEAGRDILFDIDVQGASQLKTAFFQPVLVFILPPDIIELKRRLKLRGTEKDDAIELRLKNALHEISSAWWYDYLIINDKLETAVNDLFTLYHSATLQLASNRDTINKFLVSMSNEKYQN